MRGGNFTPCGLRKFAVRAKRAQSGLFVILVLQSPRPYGKIKKTDKSDGARQRAALVYAKHTPRCQMVLFSIKCRTLHLSKIML